MSPEINDRPRPSGVPGSRRGTPRGQRPRRLQADDFTPSGCTPALRRPAETFLLESAEAGCVPLLLRRRLRRRNPHRVPGTATWLWRDGRSPACRQGRSAEGPGRALELLHTPREADCRRWCPAWSVISAMTSPAGWSGCPTPTPTTSASRTGDDAGSEMAVLDHHTASLAGGQRHQLRRTADTSPTRTPTPAGGCGRWPQPSCSRPCRRRRAQRAAVAGRSGASAPPRSTRRRRCGDRGDQGGRGLPDRAEPTFETTAPRRARCVPGPPPAKPQPYLYLLRLDGFAIVGSSLRRWCR